MMITALVRLDETPAPTSVLPREIDPNVVTPGIVGLLFFIALFVAVFFLMRSFVRQLKKIDLPDDHAPAEGAAAAPTDDSPADATLSGGDDSPTVEPER